MPIINSTYQSATYNELSEEFKVLCPTVVRAFQLIGLIYNRLTLVDGMAHAKAVKKIYDDHGHLQGFSFRNIYRYLPSDNPNIPHRVMTRRHKSSATKSIVTKKFSSTKFLPHGEEVSKTNAEISVEATVSNDIECPRCAPVLMRNEELEEALKASAGPTIATNYAPQIQRFTIIKERRTELIEAMEKCVEFIYLEFDNIGTLLSVTPDLHYKGLRKRHEMGTA